MRLVSVTLMDTIIAYFRIVLYYVLIVYIKMSNHFLSGFETDYRSFSTVMTF